jgi:hypothetical protein
VNYTGTKKVALWNKWHFEEKNRECAACLKYSILIFVEKIYIKYNISRVGVYRTHGSWRLTKPNLVTYKICICVAQRQTSNKHSNKTQQKWVTVRLCEKYFSVLYILLPVMFRPGGTFLFIKSSACSITVSNTTCFPRALIS